MEASLMRGTFILYDTQVTPPQRKAHARSEIARDLQFAIYRFQTSERRMPAAIVMPTQLAREFMEDTGHHLIGDLSMYGILDGIPVLGRDAQLDPLYQLI